MKGYLDRWGLSACLILGLVLRVVAIWFWSGELIRDRDAYLAIARGVASGQGMVDPDRLRPTAFRPPFYPLELASLMTLMPAAAAVATINLGWGAVTVWATWRAAESLDLGPGRIVAGLLVAMDPMLLQYSAQPMTEVTCAGLVALLVYVTVRPGERPPARQWTLGALFGLLVCCRPTFWPLAGFVALGQIAFGLVVGHDSGSNFSLPARRFVTKVPWRVILGSLLVLAPWVIRNQIVLGSPVVMTTHGGYTLLLGNNSSFYTNVVDRGWGSEWTAESFDAWQRELQANLDRELGRDASEIARDQWQSRVARQFIAANPQRFLSAVWQRVRSLWSTMPQREATSGMNPLILAAVGWYYSLVLTAFVVGLTVAGWQGLWLNIPLTSSLDETSKLRSQTRSDQSCRAVAWTLISLVLTVQAVHLVYWTNARMRAPIAPVIGLLAGVTTGKFGRSSPG